MIRRGPNDLFNLILWSMLYYAGYQFITKQCHKRVLLHINVPLDIRGSEHAGHRFSSRPDLQEHLQQRVF
jgi:hypothetical protein